VLPQLSPAGQGGSLPAERQMQPLNGRNAAMAASPSPLSGKCRKPRRRCRPGRSPMFARTTAPIDPAHLQHVLQPLQRARTLPPHIPALR